MNAAKSDYVLQIKYRALYITSAYQDKGKIRHQKHDSDITFYPAIV